MHMIVLLIDIGFLILNVTCAIINRGTLIGYMFTALVLWQVFSAISAIKSVYEED